MDRVIDKDEKLSSLSYHLITYHLSLFIMQSSLFDETPGESSETLDEINAELLQRAKAMPQLADRIFIFGEGKKRARGWRSWANHPERRTSTRASLFMGPAGQMLNRILGSHRPQTRRLLPDQHGQVTFPAEMKLTPDILSFFTPYLHRELSGLSYPQVVIAFGNTPMRALLKTKKPISQMRGEFHDYQGMQLMPTFNPAYLLRDPSKKREVWEDMKKVRALLIS